MQPTNADIIQQFKDHADEDHRVNEKQDKVNEEFLLFKAEAEGKLAKLDNIPTREELPDLIEKAMGNALRSKGKTFYAVVEPAPGATKTWTFKSRIDTGGGPGNGTLVVTWGDPSTTGPPDTTHSDSYAAGNLVDWASTPTGSPTSVTKVMLSAVSYIAPTAATPLLMLMGVGT